jgi:hypothetical protein
MLGAMSTLSRATLPILPVGRHVATDGRALEFTEDTLREIAESYDPARSEAPLVIGHPKTNDPAYGWAKSLEVRGGMLYAEPHQVVPEFAEAANRKLYKKRSASVYLPDSPGNPLPGKHYLRHIGFLGAMPPAIKGIPDAALEFAETDGALALEFAESAYAVSGIAEILRKLRDYFIEREGSERADEMIPQWQLSSIEESARQDAQAEPVAFSEITAAEGVDPGTAAAAAPGEPVLPEAPAAAASASTLSTPKQDTAMTDQAAQERERKLAEREQQVAAREAQLQQATAVEQRREAAAFAEQLVSKGQLLPRQKAPVVELLLNLPAAPLEFAEGDGTTSKPGSEVLRELLSSLPAQVDFSEKSAGAGSEQSDDPASLAAKARAYQREQAKAGNQISTTAAVKHVRGAQL